MPADAPRLQLQSVTRRYGALVVTNGLSLEVGAGQAFGVIGPNGAGKSTLLKLINGQVRPDGGRVLFEGRDVTALPPEQRCRAGIATAFQVPQPFGAMSVYENLLVAATWATGRGERACRAECGALLDRTGLAAHADRDAGSLGLLDRKRLELARALACRPRLLLLDEIAGGLTDHEIPALLAIIQPLRAEGISVLWIEHVVHALLAVVERLLVIDFGTRVAEGEPREVFGSAEVQRLYLGLGDPHAA